MYSSYNQHTYIIYITCILKIISLTRKMKAKKQMDTELEVAEDR